MPRDSEATKARIFAAATTEFAAHGIAGARVDRIAREASANKQLIYAYFGGKEALFGAVLERALADLAASVPIDGTDLPGYVDRLHAYHDRHPELLRLLLWEALERGEEPIAAEAERTEHYRDKVASVREGQEQGKVTKEFAPEVLTFLLLQFAKWPSVVPQIRRMLLGPDADPAELASALHTAVERLTRP
ncbi:TetR family transcriptional regulator [Prauserella flavalba]|uniref:TetR family transcriptional regulator n=1 Tax=Prauserella flavalba TaxID=1477506 RepID=A0A318M023_9PSEU|nr:TetR family transcriptional regulator [Prauserella flavalba]PXY38398.1 TetR family transcriptional regulator [Prauserella flavalba]